jgi:quercetin dioxygenase-like cupin family protein
MSSEQSATATPIMRDRGEGERRWFAGGGVHTWKATAAETGGRMMAFEEHVDGGKATPSHSHPDADELLFVVEGEIAVDTGAQQRRLGAGGFTFVPRGVPHAFVVLSPSARILTVQTPGGGDVFYLSASDASASVGSDGTMDLGRVMSSARATGTTSILGPPPAFELGG